MRRPSYDVSGSVFYETAKNMENFCHNLFLSNALEECVIKMIQAQTAYETAVLQNDTETIAAKKIELQTYQSSLTLTALMFAEVDEIST